MREYFKSVDILYIKLIGYLEERFRLLKLLSMLRCEKDLKYETLWTKPEWSARFRLTELRKL